MTDKKTATPLSDLGEFGLIERLTKPFGIKNSATVKGIGDDAAIIKSEGNDLVVQATFWPKASTSTLFTRRSRILATRR